MSELPTFLVVGAMRSGTTSLARYLGAHPDVHVAPKKEVHFFDGKFERGVDWYRTQFAASGESAIGEATPAYMYDGRAIARIGEVVPDARLIVVLRDPVDRAYSHYWQNVARGHEPRSFEEAVASAAPARGIGRAYVEAGRYLPQLQRLGEHFPRERLRVFLFDDLQVSPEQLLADAFDFLGVEQIMPSIVGTKLNAYQEFRFASLRRSIQRLPRAAANALGRLNRVDGAYAPIDDGFRARLAARYAEDNAALAEWLGVDLSGWSS